MIKPLRLGSSEFSPSRISYLSGKRLFISLWALLHTRPGVPFLFIFFLWLLSGELALKDIDLLSIVLASVETYRYPAAQKIPLPAENLVWFINDPTGGECHSVVFSAGNSMISGIHKVHKEAFNWSLGFEGNFPQFTQSTSSPWSLSRKLKEASIRSTNNSHLFTGFKRNWVWGFNKSKAFIYWSICMAFWFSKSSLLPSALSRIIQPQGEKKKTKCLVTVAARLHLGYL